MVVIKGQDILLKTQTMTKYTLTISLTLALCISVLL